MIEPRAATCRLAGLAILASAVLGAPALACQNPSFAARGAAWQPTPQSAPPADAIAEAVADVDAHMLAEYSHADWRDWGGSRSIVGMWHAILRLGNDNGPVYDEVLQHFHSDGTELIISNGLPPALGNVCIGVWKRVGSRTFKLRHMTWNWSSDDGGFGVPGALAGHFELEATLRLDYRGNSLTGTWTAKNYDTQGVHIPALDAEGVMTGVRITVD